MGLLKVVFSVLAIIVSIFVFYLMKPESPGEVPTISDVWWGEGDRKAESEDITPFKYESTQADLQDLEMRLKNTRYFKSLENARWDYGARPDFMKKVVDYWLNTFSWKKQEKLINDLPNFKTNIDGIALHFIHVKPSNVQPGTKLVPVLMLHGWPGSFHEFYKAIPLMTEERDGFAFEVIVPSLPGYGFSSPARKTGMGPAQIGLIMKKLMNRLGHSKFYIQGGDWGSSICRNMAILFPSEIKGAHMNFWPMLTNPRYPILTHVIGAVAPSWVLPEKDHKRFFPLWNILKMLLEETGYLHIQATKPDTVGFALNDSPAGLASYILEKFVSATESRTDDAIASLEKRLTLDEVLTNVMIYWLTGTMPSAVRLYKEAFHCEHGIVERRNIYVPVGFAAYPEEAQTPPKSWLQAQCKNLVSYTEMKSGGHFAAFEEPESFARDVRMFIGKVENQAQN